MSGSRWLMALVAVVIGFASACSATVDIALEPAADPVEVALADFVNTQSFRGREPVGAATAECIASRLVGRVGRDALVDVGLTEPSDTTTFFQASVVWPAEFGSAFDRVVTGCERHLEVRSAGATFGGRLANGHVAPTFGEEFCLGEWLLSVDLDAETAPLPADGGTVDHIDPQAVEALRVTTDAVGTCLGLGRSVLSAYNGSESLRPATVECLLKRGTDVDYRTLVALTSALPTPTREAAEDLIGYLSNCMTDQEVATAVGLT